MAYGSQRQAGTDHTQAAWVNPDDSYEQRGPEDWLGDAWGSISDWASGGPGHEPHHYTYDESQYGQHRDAQGDMRGDQAWLSRQYQNMINGTGPSVAQNQLREATAANQRNAMAMARSGTGPMAGGAQYQAAQNAAATQQASNRQMATLRAQEQAAAMQGLSGHAGTTRGQDISMLQTEQGYQTDKAGVYAQTEAAKASAAEEYAKRKGGSAMFTAGIGAGLIGGMFGTSDERAKARISDSDWKREDWYAGQGGGPQGSAGYGVEGLAADPWASRGAAAGPFEPDNWESEFQGPDKRLDIVRDFPGDKPARQLRDDLAGGPSLLDTYRTPEETFGSKLAPERRFGITAQDVPEADWSAFGEGGVLAPYKGQTPVARPYSGKEKWDWANWGTSGDKEADAAVNRNKGTGNTYFDSGQVIGDKLFSDSRLKAGTKGDEVAAAIREQKGDVSEAQGGGMGGMLGGMLGGMMDSDERGKNAPSQVSGRELDGFMSDLEPYKYTYKPGVPGEDPSRPYVGVMAQDVDDSRVGKTIVRETPGGMKMLDTTHGFGTTLAALGRLNERLDALERRGRS